jgi:nitrate/nitrite transport system ATP-binding protein
MSLLDLRGVGKNFGARRVLDGVNLSLEEGEFVSIIGYSGSGKTTLVSLIAGLLKPDAGTILLEGRPLGGPGPDRGVIFQNYSLLPWMTVFDNVRLAVEAVSPGLSKEQVKEKTEHFLAMVKLDKALAKYPRELSGGMRQRVAVARGLAMDPKILLLDEPFSALDALTRGVLQEELRRIWETAKKTVVLVTNDVDEAALLSDRIVPLTAGPGAALGPSIPVDIPRPRQLKTLSLEPGYPVLRRKLVDFLIQNKPASPQPLIRASGPPSPPRGEGRTHASPGTPHVPSH